MFADKLKDVET